MFRALKVALLGVVFSSTFGIFAPAMSVRAAEFSDINSSTSASQGIIFSGICPPNVNGEPAPCECRDSGTCSLDDVLQVFVNLSTFILGISGAAVLFVFVYGGFKWVFSRGDSKWITAGKDAITASVIGLCIIFGAYVAINFIVSGLTTKSGSTPATTNLETTVNQSVTNGSPTTGIFTTE